MVQVDRARPAEGGVGGQSPHVEARRTPRSARLLPSKTAIGAHVHEGGRQTCRLGAGPGVGWASRTKMAAIRWSMRSAPLTLSVVVVTTEHPGSLGIGARRCWPFRGPVGRSWRRRAKQSTSHCSPVDPFPPWCSRASRVKPAASAAVPSCWCHGSSKRARRGMASFAECEGDNGSQRRAPARPAPAGVLDEPVPD